MKTRSKKRYQTSPTPQSKRLRSSSRLSRNSRPDPVVECAEDSFSPEDTPIEHACNCCKETFEEEHDLQEHFVTFHKFKKVAKRQFRDSNVLRYTDFNVQQPVIDNPEFICGVCDHRQYINKVQYRKHLTKIHGMILPRESVRGIPFDPEEAPVTESSAEQNVKVEEDQVELLQVESSLVVEKNELRCYICNLEYPNPTSCKRHIMVKHKLVKTDKVVSRLADGFTKNNPDDYLYMIPGTDPKFCVFCDTTYSTKKAFKKHLKSEHNATVWPDIQDTKYYCRNCNRSFKTAGVYKTHCRDTHNMYLQKLLTAIAEKSLKPNYCNVCDKYWDTVDEFQAHFATDHDKLQVVETPYKLVVPETKGIDFYCSECDVLFKVKQRYKTHMEFKHQSTFDNSIMPDPDDPNFYCKSCNKHYGFKVAFRAHLRTSHQIRDNPIPERRLQLLPDPEDPNFFCRSCLRNYTTRSHYRRHLLIIHMMESPSREKV